METGLQVTKRTFCLKNNRSPWVLWAGVSQRKLSENDGWTNCSRLWQMTQKFIFLLSIFHMLNHWFLHYLKERILTRIIFVEFDFVEIQISLMTKFHIFSRNFIFTVKIHEIELRKYFFLQGLHYLRNYYFPVAYF